jgi:two-component system alkaline phosphatase synthesis response regulator PhoP
MLLFNYVGSIYFGRKNMKKILVIEDEPNILELVLYNLQSNGYDGIGAEDGITGLEKISSENPDLVLLDIMLPGKNGLEICRELRESGDTRPIIMLTAKSDETDRVMGLECGADDYISKPFGIRELMARIMAVLRRYEESYPFPSQGNAEEKSSNIRIGSLTMDEERYRVTVEGILVPLTAIEFQLLYFLAKSPGIVFTRNQLLDKVWGIEYMGETRTVDVHIRHLRKKLAIPFGEKGKSMEDHFIETIRGKGYRFR